MVIVHTFGPVVRAPPQARGVVPVSPTTRDLAATRSRNTADLVTGESFRRNDALYRRSHQSDLKSNITSSRHVFQNACSPQSGSTASRRGANRSSPSSAAAPANPLVHAILHLSPPRHAGDRSRWRPVASPRARSLESSLNDLRSRPLESSLYDLRARSLESSPYDLRSRSLESSL